MVATEVGNELAASINDPAPNLQVHLTRRAHKVYTAVMFAQEKGDCGSATTEGHPPLCLTGKKDGSDCFQLAPKTLDLRAPQPLFVFIYVQGYHSEPLGHGS